MNMTSSTFDEKKKYRTADLALATALSLSFSIEAIERDSSRKAHFIFLRNKNLDTAIESFWRGDLKVEPQAYHSQLRVVKARLYGDQ
jgi:hypothetical protein